MYKFKVITTSGAADLSIDVDGFDDRGQVQISADANDFPRSMSVMAIIQDFILHYGYGFRGYRFTIQNASPRDLMACFELYVDKEPTTDPDNKQLSIIQFALTEGEVPEDYE